MADSDDGPGDKDKLLANSRSSRKDLKPALPRYVVVAAVVCITLSTLIQETLFWLLTWKTALSSALAVQGLWVFLSLVIMCYCSQNFGVMHFPFSPKGRLLWTLLVGCGMLVGAITAMAGGYEFAHFSKLYFDQINFDKAVSADHLSVSGQTRLAKLDYIRFAPGFRVLKTAGFRTTTEDHQFVCAAPIVGQHETGAAYFYAVSDDNHCCSFDAFTCFGWDGTVPTAEVIAGSDLAQYIDAVNFASQKLASTKLPHVIVEFSHVDPAAGARVYLVWTLWITGCGLLVWPIPAMCWYWNKR